MTTKGLCRQQNDGKQPYAVHGPAILHWQFRSFIR